jgi:hypothetical protein
MSKRDRLATAERIIAAISDSDGRFSTSDAIVALAAVYRDQPDLLDPDAQARADVTAIDRARRPDPSQESLFDKDAWLPLGKGDRVRMGAARLDDLDAWWLVELDEHTKHAAAHSRKASYINSRRQAWTPDDHCLLDVENRIS